MISLVNQPFLAKRAKWAKWGTYVGLGALLLGLFTVGRSPILAYVFMLVGLIAATLSSYLGSRYVREPRADQVLARELEALDKRYALYNFYLPSDHVIVSHYGLMAVVPRFQEGEVTYRRGRWRHKSGWRKVFQLFGEPALGKPDQDLGQEIKAVKEWIDQVMPEQNVPVNGAVVFTSPKVTLEVSDAPVPAMSATDLITYMKQGLKGQPTLSTAAQTELRKILDQVVGQD
jgi:hypothetical protein